MLGIGAPICSACCAASSGAARLRSRTETRPIDISRFIFSPLPAFGRAIGERIKERCFQIGSEVKSQQRRLSWERNVLSLSEVPDLAWRPRNLRPAGKAGI